MQNRIAPCARWFMFVIAAMIAPLTMPSLARADVIPVANFSFENADEGPLLDNGTSSHPTSWASVGGGMYNPVDAQFAGTTDPPTYANIDGIIPDGGQVGIITTYFGGPLGGSLTQTVGTVAANTHYTLTVSIGTRADDTPAGGWTIELLAGSTVIASNTGEGGPAPGTTGAFVDESAISLQTGDGSDPNVGQPLMIKLIGFNITGNTTIEQDQFDDVRLTVAPEPASVSLLAIGVVTLVRRRRAA